MGQDSEETTHGLEPQWDHALRRHTNGEEEVLIAR